MEPARVTRPDFIPTCTRADRLGPARETGCKFKPCGRTFLFHLSGWKRPSRLGIEWEHGRPFLFKSSRHVTLLLRKTYVRTYFQKKPEEDFHLYEKRWKEQICEKRWSRSEPSLRGRRGPGHVRLRSLPGPLWAPRCPAARARSCAREHLGVISMDSVCPLASCVLRIRKAQER